MINPSAWLLGEPATKASVEVKSSQNDQYNDGIVAIPRCSFAGGNGGELTKGQGWHTSTLGQKPHDAAGSASFLMHDSHAGATIE
jgi:hypothetical protein